MELAAADTREKKASAQKKVAAAVTEYRQAKVTARQSARPPKKREMPPIPEGEVDIIVRKEEILINALQAHVLAEKFEEEVQKCLDEFSEANLLALEGESMETANAWHKAARAVARKREITQAPGIISIYGDSSA